MRALGNKQVKETLAGDEKNRVSDIYGTEMNPNLEEVQALQRIWERWVRPYNEAVKAVEELRVANEQFCPECGSDLIDHDGESEADGVLKIGQSGYITGRGAARQSATGANQGENSCGVVGPFRTPPPTGTHEG